MDGSVRVSSGEKMAIMTTITRIEPPSIMFGLRRRARTGARKLPRHPPPLRAIV